MAFDGEEPAVHNSIFFLEKFEVIKRERVRTYTDHENILIKLVVYLGLFV